MCFLERGYHQTGVRDIAARAGVSLGNLYNHFPGKHDVLVEIAVLERDEMKPLLKLLAKPSPAPEVLESFVDAYAKYLASPENVILSLEIASEAIRKADIAELFMENRNELTKALTELLERGAQQDDLRQLSNPHQFAQLVIETIEGSAYRCVLSSLPMRKAIKSLREFVLSAVTVR